MSKTRSLLIQSFAFLSLLFFNFTTYSQTLKEPGIKYFINRVNIVGNEYHSAAVLEAELRTKQNSYLFFKPVKIGLWSYYFFDFILPDFLFSQYETKKFKDYVLNSFGEAPVIFNYSTFQDDLVYMKAFYHNYGFFEAKIDTGITIDGKSLDITFKFNENTQRKIDRINYNFNGSISQPEIEEIISKNSLKNSADYSVFSIRDERDRLVNQLLDKGYAFTTADSIQVLADTSVYPLVNLTFNVNPSLISRINEQNMYINTQREEDTLVYPINPVKTENGFNIYSTDTDELDPEILLRQTDLEKSALYTPQNRISSLRNLGELGVFRSVDVRIDSVIINDKNFYDVYPRYELALSPKHEIRPELRVDTKSNGSFGLDVIYTNKNIFHSAEYMRINVGGALQIPLLFFFGSDTSSNFGSEWSLNTGIDFNFPYFFGTRNKSQISFKAQRAKKQRYNFTNVSLGLKVEYKHSEITRSYFDLWELNWVDAGDLYFSRISVDSLIRGPYLNSVFRWTIQRSNTDPVNRNYGNTQEFFLEESGLIPRLVSNYVNAADQKVDEVTGSIYGLDYFQYVKAQSEFRWYFQNGPTTVMAYKILFGYMQPYGVSSQTPVLNRFIAGGPSSLRGWFPATIGPGSSTAINNGYADIKLEGSIEYRKTWSESWGSSFFIDYGNVWDRTGIGAFKMDTFYKEIGFNYGVGIKYFLPIGPVRFDFAWKAYDPSKAEGERLVLRKWRFGELWNTISIYFGIGHAF